MTVTANKEGDYILRAQAYAQQAGNEPARMEFRLDGKSPHDLRCACAGQPAVCCGASGCFSPALLLPQPQFFEFKTRLPQGEHQFTAAFVNAFSDPANSNPNLRTRNLVVRALEVASLSEPALMPPMSETMQSIFPNSRRRKTERAAGASHPRPVRLPRLAAAGRAGRNWIA